MIISLVCSHYQCLGSNFQQIFAMGTVSEVLYFTNLVCTTKLLDINPLKISSYTVYIISRR